MYHPIYTRAIISAAELTILQKKGYSHTTVWTNSRIPELESHCIASAEGSAEAVLHLRRDLRRHLVICVHRLLKQMSRSPPREPSTKAAAPAAWSMLKSPRLPIAFYILLVYKGDGPPSYGTWGTDDVLSGLRRTGSGRRARGADYVAFEKWNGAGRLL